MPVLFPRAACAAFCWPLISIVTAAPAQAVPDWREDGRVGYETRAEARALAQAFTAPGGPLEGHGFTVYRDPDGGFTPVFHDPKEAAGTGA